MSKRIGEAREDVARTLGLGQARAPGGLLGFMGLPRWAVLTGAAAILLLLVFVFLSLGRSKASPYVTEEVARGALTVSVSATGSLEPVTTVDVGSEISGRLDSVLVDYNDEVKKGQLLARIDTTQLAANVAKSEANLAAARAAVLTSEATLRETSAKAKRARELAPSGSISREVLETAIATAERAVADLASARARVTVAEAELASEKTTLGKAEITSPIDGVVISRDVDPGQTVAATFQTPKLFTLAEDLRRMQLQVDVDEADVGEVKAGQDATFTVDAYPNRRFEAKIESVRFASQTKNGVVSYTAILTVDNADLLLRPGMTATADIVTAAKSDVLLAPNGALRFTPPGEKTTKTAAKAGDIEKIVWTLDGGKPKAIPVRAGLTDGQHTEILSGDLEPGMALLVDVAGAAKTP
ncbi:MAG: efflux RND transporter periplasmic adaptor subunit [Parvibaculum sp.]|uniref:efflux RND transporter periplasmic adaptor subunit n=1 Tax=Parvibaculum sp. TaxID=2024848 RepID=UPI0025E15834|nr:efflux RND transporter periplasmic adaptor subunit [Parvibaculum sp.]MCE9651180.1 efflux RND transporter periplasmic adaptor subunit [Parvibaculum sp.]